MNANRARTLAAALVTLALVLGTVSPALAAATTAAVPPVDFATADLTGKAAATTEGLLGQWGFGYWGTDGKWSDEDTYELTLFQRWAGLTPNGKVTKALRSKMAAAWATYGATAIPRTRLPLEGRYIGVNAGHQGKPNNGRERVSPEKGSETVKKVTAGTTGVASRVPEYKINLKVALRLQTALQDKGARVLMARTTHNVNISNASRARTMNDAGVDLLLSLHCDGSLNRSKTGLHTLQPAKRGYQKGDVLKNSRALAALIQEEAIDATGAKDRGLNDRDDLASLNWAKMPVCLVEMGYMTNKAEDRKLNTTAYQKKLVKGFVAGITRYFQEAQ